MLSFKYTGTCYYNFICYLIWTVLTILIFSDCVVIICSSINLMLISLQTSKNTISPFTGSFTRRMRKINIFFQSIKIQLRKSDYYILKYSKINIIQSISLFLYPNIHYFLFKSVFVAYISFWSLRNNLDIMLNQRFKNSSLIFLAMITMFLPEVLMDMLYKNQIPDSICKIHDNFLVSLHCY